MKTKTTPMILCNVICAVLMLALLLFQALPFWDIGTQQISIQQYIGFPADYPELTSYFQAQLNPDFMVNDVVLMPIIVLVIGLLGAVFCIWKCKKCWVFLFPMICGIAGMWGYLTNPAFQMGAMWQLHLVLSILMTLLSIVPLCYCVVQIKQWCFPYKNA